MTRSATELTTITLRCPVWGEVAEVTAFRDERGRITVVGCSLSELGSACLPACEAEVRRWCELAS